MPVRDLATLQAHHDGLGGSLLAGALIRNAVALDRRGRRRHRGAGGGVGDHAGQLGHAALELAAETLMVVAIEMKLVAELHEAAGMTLPTSSG